MERTSRLNNPFSGILEKEGSPVEGQKLQQRDKKEEGAKISENLMLVEGKAGCLLVNGFLCGLNDRS